MTEPKNNTGKIVLIVAIVFVVLAGASCLCVIGGSVFGALGLAAGVEKTYYPECENLDNDECRTCCTSKGHSGQAIGNLLNDEGKNCGCL